jgi:cbb3-type cytochrome c oxidase subunit III
MRANKHLLLWSSLGTLVVLLWAAYSENTLQEWRVLQRRYKDLLPSERAGAFRVQLRQVVVPELDVSDRCVSCHLGMAPGEPGVPGDPVFAPHPAVGHEPTRFGCVVCHAGQGRATTRDDAHGTVAHWPEPMIPIEYAHAGCGACHTHLAVPNLARLDRGSALFERLDCLACHRTDGRGGTLRPGGHGGMEGPELSRIGAVGYDEAWYAKHLERAREGTGTWSGTFAPIRDEDRALLGVFLDSRVGAPGLVESKALFHSLGCLGCHPVGGVGGDDGPDLTTVGQKDPGQLDWTHVGHERSLAAWFAEHFRAPGALVPDSAMPSFGLTEDQIDRLVLYTLALRRSELPEAFWPKDRIRAERFEEREFSTDGATLYGTFCAACHGPRGEGMRYPGMAAFPAIGNADFLEHVSDEFLRETIRRGRPGRRMPAWGELEGGLRPGEIDTLVAHLRAMAGGVQAKDDGKPRRWVRAGAQPGEGIYRESCASCHGDAGEGKEGPALSNPVFLETATDSYMVATIRDGREGTSMPGFGVPSTVRAVLSDAEIESVVAFVRGWEDER